LEGGDFMSRRIWFFLGMFVLIPILLSGCGFYETRDQIRSAEKSLGDLKSAGGEKLAPYEYCSAEQYLGISKVFLNRAEYKNARDFGARSKSASEAGLLEVKKK
jgi:hypothetical protein